MALTETQRAKARLRKELGLNGRLSGVGDTTNQRMADQISATLERESARARLAEGGDEYIDAARDRADPEGVLSDEDVDEVLR